MIKTATSDTGEESADYLTDDGKGFFSMLQRADITAEFSAFVTLTFKVITSRDDAVRAAKWWVRKLSRIYLKKAKGLPAREAHAMSSLLPHAYCAEPHASGGYHVHVLLAAPGLDLRPAARLWGASYGHADIRTFDSSRNARSYVLKRVGRDGVFDLARELFAKPESPAS